MKVEGGAPIKTVPLEHQGTVDPPDISIAEGEGKRRKPSSLSPKSVESDRTTAGSNEVVVDDPGNADGFPARANQGDVDKNGTTDEIDWASMVQEEVQDHQNDADKLYICPINILLCYWRSYNGKLMLRITGLNGLYEDKIKADNVKIYYPDTLALYLIGNSIEVKKARESRNFRLAKEWHDWAVRFTNAKTMRIARLVRIIGSNYLEAIFRSQVTMSMMRPLRYHQLRLARLKKPSGKDQSAPNNGGLKYSMKVPRNAKEDAQFDAQFDQENGNKLWSNEIFKYLEALMSMKVFRKLPSSLLKSGAKGFQFAPIPVIFDVKVDLRRKARLVIGVHIVNSFVHKVYASTMNSVSARILMTISAANNLYIMTGDIGNAYLNSNTQENIYTRAGTEFELVDIMTDDTLMEVIKALYGLPTSRNR